MIYIGTSYYVSAASYAQYYAEAEMFRVVSNNVDFIYFPDSVNLKENFSFNVFTSQMKEILIDTYRDLDESPKAFGDMAIPPEESLKFFGEIYIIMNEASLKSSISFD